MVRRAHGPGGVDGDGACSAIRAEGAEHETLRTEPLNGEGAAQPFRQLLQPVTDAFAAGQGLGAG